MAYYTVQVERQIAEVTVTKKRLLSLDEVDVDPLSVAREYYADFWGSETKKEEPSVPSGSVRFVRPDGGEAVRVIDAFQIGMQEYETLKGHLGEIVV